MQCSVRYDDGMSRLSDPLAEHLEEKHNISPILVHIRDVVYGGVDGIITTFAVVSGFSGAMVAHDTTAQLSFAVVLLFGLANLCADAVSMGLGNFLAVRSEQSAYCGLRAEEAAEIKNNPALEAEETVMLLMHRGFTEKDARAITALYRKNPDYWIDFMMDHEIKMTDSTDVSPVWSGIATAGAFMVFGSLPLMPFIFDMQTEPGTVFLISAGCALASLALLGALKAQITRLSYTKTIAEVVTVGVVASSVAFFIGSLFAV